MASFTFKQGKPVEILVTPDADTAAGAAIEVGDIPAIAHSPVTVDPDRPGSFFVGPARYSATQTGVAAFDAGEAVYLLDGNIAKAGKHFGFAAEAIIASADEVSFSVVHNPNGSVAAAA